MNHQIITIPPTIDEAVSQLTGLGALLTATEWERAAIVAAFVEPASHGGDRSKSSSGVALETATDFAKRKITGLKSTSTVLRYVEAWQSSGQPRPEPGQEIELTIKPFPVSEDVGRTISGQRAEAIREQATADKTGGSKAIDIASNPRAMAAAIKADQATAEAARAALGIDFDMPLEPDGTGGAYPPPPPQNLLAPTTEQIRAALANPDVAEQVMQDLHTRAQTTTAMQNVHRDMQDQVSAQRETEGRPDPLQHNTATEDYTGALWRAFREVVVYGAKVARFGVEEDKRGALMEMADEAGLVISWLRSGTSDIDAELQRLFDQAAGE